MRGLARWFRWLLVAGVVALVVGVAWVFFRLELARPRVDASLLIDGVSAPVEVIRDVDGVPHIRAATEKDALFALGFVHAQERLWQMEFQRRLGSGRLSEVLGPSALQTDRLFRTIGLARAASALWPRLSPATREMTEAYVAGVNTFLARTPRRALPIEFAIVRAVPEPFRPQDALVWSKVVTLLLSTNFRDELLRARLVARIGDDGAAALMPAYTAGGPLILPDGLPSAQARPAPPTSDPALSRLAGEIGRGLGPWTGPVVGIGASNNWVLAGSRTTTGKPILANDPHLPAQLPAIWYLAHVEGGRLNAIGATLPGVPGIVIGHNARIAWGVTNVMTDNQDLFVERVNAANQAFFQGAWEPMRLAHETIRVKGRPDVPILVRSTRHGPLISDVIDADGQALALRWTALDDDDSTVEAFLGVNVARDFAEFSRSVSKMHGAMQNFVYADVDGTIGYIAPGAIPVRARGDGTLPVPGWTGEYDWRGYVDPSMWPRAVNPARGYVVTANNKVVPDEYPYPISSNWEPGSRAARIIELITAVPRHSPDEVARMQLDVRSVQAREVLPWLLRATVGSEQARRAADLLRAWDGTLDGASAGAAVYETWMARVAERLFADDLGADLWHEYGTVTPWVVKALHRVASTGDRRWCDVVTTRQLEACETMLGKALDDALADQARVQGTNDVGRWRWDLANEVRFAHQPLDRLPLVGWWLGRTVAAGGDATTVNPVLKAKDQTFVASYRQVIDLSDFERSRFILTVGQSGHPVERRYDDQLGRWAVGDNIPMRFSRKAVDAAAANRLELRPQRPGLARAGSR